MNDHLPKVAILLGFGLFLMLLAVRRLRHYRLKERYTLLFVFSAVPFLGLAVWPGAIGWLARHLDIQYYTLALMIVSAYFILMIFELLTIVSVQDRRINTLAQIVGVMMEKHGMSDRQTRDASDTSDPSGILDAPDTTPRREAGESTRAQASKPFEQVR